ncbi:hypothetical protein [Streptomyces sp. NBC_00083]|uniref:hypothetical protein n=1 Tax=Streptomyces sp. NBC_00083 TaxID=2975647 RepID=UPI002250E980|nr:hypothetical protein [Streptomyces sp. NBC_00083]MCX5384187.1 hypothetical protein [Streptomyces sp. NBC_00083]
MTTVLSLPSPDRGLMRTKILGCLFGVASMTAVALIGAPGAQAAPPTASHSAPAATISVPAGKDSTTVTVGGSAVTVTRSAPSAAVLTCTVSPGKPYHGTAGVTSTVWAYCNSNAATLTFGTALYLHGSNVGQNNETKHNCTFCYVTVTAPYQAGQWKSGAILGYFDSSGNGQFTAEAYSATATL